jgi:hypothetical protein
MRVQEISPNTHKGSWTEDLTLGKLWALVELKKIKNKFDVIYVLGSWYGNTSIMLSLLKKYFDFEHIVNVEIDKKSLEKSEKIIDQLGINDSIEFMLADANELDYRQLGKDGLVINMSAVDIAGEDWLNNIPTGTTVLIQGRDNVPNAANDFDSLEDLQRTYALSRVLYKGTKTLQDPETKFQSFLLIGQK